MYQVVSNSITEIYAKVNKLRVSFMSTVVLTLKATAIKMLSEVININSNKIRHET